MNLSSSTLKERAKSKLKNDYWLAFAVTLLSSFVLSIGSGFASAISSVTNIINQISNDLYHSNGFYNITLSSLQFPGISTILGIVAGGVIMIGSATFFLKLADGKKGDFMDLFKAFKDRFGNAILMYILINVFTILWSLLFIVPGIIASLSYSMTPYILSEHPEMDATDAIKLSKQMMKGNKGKLFWLYFSFIGWFILCILTFGVGLLFLEPYVNASVAEFFNEVSGKNYQKQQEYTQFSSNTPGSSQSTDTFGGTQNTSGGFYGDYNSYDSQTYQNNQNNNGQSF
jgi:uncharacterized membrane protein